MQKPLITLLLSFLLARSFAQTTRPVSFYLKGRYSKTLRDRTIGNNPWGIGLGFQVFLNNTSWFRPTIDLTADAYLEDDKVLRLDSNGNAINEVGGMVNLFAGASFHLAQSVYFSLVGGPSFVSQEVRLGLKPSLGYYLSKKQKCTVKISYLTIVHRDRVTNEDFSSLSLSFGVRLF